jgi:hypothetical protein
MAMSTMKHSNDGGAPWELITGEADQLPLVVRATQPSARIDLLDPDTVIDWIKTYGGILLRGFRFRLSSFERLTSQLCVDFLFNESPGRETISIENQIQSVDLGPAPFALHAEMARVPWRPDLAIFACFSPPSIKGETLACDGIKLADSLRSETRDYLKGRDFRYMQEASAEFCQKWLGVANPSEEELQGLAANTPYQFFMQNQIIYYYFLAPVFEQPLTGGREAFANFLLFTRDMHKTKTFPTFADGEEISDELCDEIREVAKSCTTEVRWQRNDIVILDNSRFMHGRNEVVAASGRQIWTRFGYAGFLHENGAAKNLKAWRRYRELGVDDSTSDFDPGRLWDSPEQYLVQFDGAKACFAHMDRNAYLQSIFTNVSRIKTAAPQQWTLPLSTLLDLHANLAGDQTAPGFIFHPAHCGSTLLARLLDQKNKTLVIREPFALRQLAARIASGPPGAEDDFSTQLLAALLSLLSRSWGPDQKVIIKANVPVNFILPQIFACLPEAGGVILYASFEGYLLSVLKTPRHRQWVMNICAEMAPAIRQIAGLSGIVNDELEAEQAASLLWMAQMHQFRQAIEIAPALRSLNCERLFETPEKALEAAAALFAIDLSAEELDSIINSGMLSEYAKDPTQKFDEANRLKERTQLAAQLKPVIDSARCWAEPFIQSLDIPDELPGNLLI